jgi:hypothetical protein
LIRDPAVISLAELEADVGMGHGITKPGEKLPVIGDDVAIVQGDDMTVFKSKDVAIGGPCRSALPVLAHIDAFLA